MSPTVFLRSLRSLLFKIFRVPGLGACGLEKNVGSDDVETLHFDGRNGGTAPWLQRSRRGRDVCELFRLFGLASVRLTQ